MKRSSWVLLTIGLSLVVVCVLQIRCAARDLEIVRIPESEPPTTVIAPVGGIDATRPVVLVGHGFAGSDLLMRGFSLSLARAGYVVVAWDFDGHGTNPRPFPQGMTYTALLDNAESALEAARSASHLVGDEIAILGHSMGSGVALEYGVSHPGTWATIAVSPVRRHVTLELPRNLLLLAGSLETSFVNTAKALLTEAGGAGGDPAVGTARAFSVIDGVEHISILFDPDSHAAARAWLDATFGTQLSVANFVDRRIIWYAFGIIGALLVGWALAPLLNMDEQSKPEPRPYLRRLAAPLAGALVATLVLALINNLGLHLDRALGLVVGGYLLIWFALAGWVGLLIFGYRLALPSRRLLLGGLFAFVVLWLGVGLLAQMVWIPWLLIVQRLVRWPLGVLLALPWFLVVGDSLRGEGFLRRSLGWLLQTAFLAAGMIASMRLIPGLGVLFLVLPLLPVVLGLVELATARLRGSWPFAVCGAMFLSWVLCAAFPIV